MNNKNLGSTINQFSIEARKKTAEIQYISTDLVRKKKVSSRQNWFN